MPKQNFNEKLIALLKRDQDFLDDTGELIPAAVRDHAWRLDHNLIKLLLTDDDRSLEQLACRNWDEVLYPCQTQNLQKP